MIKTNQLEEIQIRYNNPLPFKRRIRIKGSFVAYRILMDNWNENLLEIQEEFKILLLTRSNDVIGIYSLSKGGTTGTIVDAKLVFSVALKCNANSIILAHNHPSGNINPSLCDIDLTKKLVKAGKLLDVSVLDHLVITKENYYSFADEGSL
jgi:DNA repair protein RadC